MPAAGFAQAPWSVVQGFAWDLNSPSDNVTDYLLLAGRQTGVYNAVGSPKSMGNVLTGTFTIVDQGTWFFTLIAVNANGPSGFAAELQRTYP